MKSYIYKEIDKKDLKKGMYVDILINDSELKRGRLVEIISKTRPKDGLYKAKIATGEEGKVVNIVTKSELETDNFKFFNKLFFEKELYTLFDTSLNSFFISYKNIKNQKKNFVLIFTSKLIAEKSLETNSKIDRTIKVRSINRNRKIHEVFSGIEVDYFVIDLDRIIQKEKFIELENKLRNK